MKRPAIQRDGDTWVLTWDDEHVGMGIERLQETRDGLLAEITVESVAADKPGRLAGPVRLNLLSSESQTRFANALAKRVNHIDWHAVTIQACAIVAKQFREPSPTLRLADFEDDGPVEYLIPRLLPAAETTLLYGDGESGKSLLALRMALSCATGCPLPWGARVLRPVNVLVLDWETNARTMHARLFRLAQAAGLDDMPQNIHYRGATRDGRLLRSIDEELANVRADISRLEIGLVVVDSIGFAVSGPLVEDQTARTALNALRQMNPATRLVVAHVSNTSANEATRRVRPFGSAFFWNGMRSGIEARRAEDQANPDRLDVALYHRKANDGEHNAPIGLAIGFTGNAGGITVGKADIADVADLAARTSLSSRIRAALRSGDKDTAALADALDAKEATVAQTLRRMTDAIQVQGGGGRGRPATWGLLANEA